MIGLLLAAAIAAELKNATVLVVVEDESGKPVSLQWNESDDDDIYVRIRSYERKPEDVVSDGCHAVGWSYGLSFTTCASRRLVELTTIDGLEPVRTGIGAPGDTFRFNAETGTYALMTAAPGLHEVRFPEWFQTAEGMMSPVHLTHTWDFQAGMVYRLKLRPARFVRFASVAPMNQTRYTLTGTDGKVREVTDGLPVAPGTYTVWWETLHGFLLRCPIRLDETVPAGVGEKEVSEWLPQEALFCFEGERTVVFMQNDRLAWRRERIEHAERYSVYVAGKQVKIGEEVEVRPDEDLQFEVRTAYANGE